MQIFSGLYKNRKILTPEGEETRPTSGRLREALFNICQGEIEGASFLDLFAGSGAMGLEALSRGAKTATFVDNNRDSIRCIRSNLAAFGVENCGEVMFLDAFEAMKKLAKQGHQFDLIYADPPYNTMLPGDLEKNSLSAQTLVILDELIEQNLPLLKKGGTLFLEDNLKALPLEGAYKHLIFKDKRSMGRTALQRWSIGN
ncbi:MAG TPA: 16S rRNA (guanine(966)-N(2))-methyltransferase RsmD [Parachlamydiaceae bacterium]|nr:16S rRNA (guanine(966)-N(2))-methyltransferase RsmD [Parachlamydiaceae bacterium]